MVARIHKWLGLIVGLQLLVWTASGLFFAVFPIENVQGVKLWRAPDRETIDLSQVKVTMQEALARVAEDRPVRATLTTLAARPVYEIEGEIGVFLVSAETGSVLSPIDETIARDVAQTAWMGGGKLSSMTYFAQAPREAGGTGDVWRADFEGPGHRALYIRGVDGHPGPARTDLWRTYDFFWSLHIMDYVDRENFNTPWLIAVASLGLSLVLFGIVLVIHRFTRGVLKA
ncbi:MAG: PepSY domain-containing protein [Hyphomonadaceae bacterium]